MQVSAGSVRQLLTEVFLDGAVCSVELIIFTAMIVFQWRLIGVIYQQTRSFKVSLLISSVCSQ